MRRVFLDANVIFAAALSKDGRAAVLFLLADGGLCELVVSPHAVSEARRNLEVRYPQALGRCAELLRGVTVTSEATPSAITWALGQGLPEEDAPILAAAVAAQVDLLVTGDRTHFGHLYGRTVGGVLVLGLAEALGRLLGSRS